MPRHPRYSPKSIVEKAESAGLDYLAITDHDNDHAWRKERCHPPCWIRSIELEVVDDRLGHPLHLGIHNLRDHGVTNLLLDIARRQRDVYRVVETAIREGATVIVNHPWWAPGWHLHNSIEIWQLTRYFNLPVEISAKWSYLENLATLICAAEYGLAIVAASDSHVAEVTPVCTVAIGESPEEFLSNVREGHSFIISKSVSLFGHSAMVARFIKDAIQAQSFGLSHAVPLQMRIGGPLDRLIAMLTGGYFVEKPKRRSLAEAVVSSLAFLVGALILVPQMHLHSLLAISKQPVWRRRKGSFHHREKLTSGRFL